MHHSTILTLALAAAEASALLTKRDTPTPESEEAAGTAAPVPDPTTLVLTSVVSITPTAPEQQAGSTVIVTETRTNPSVSTTSTTQNSSPEASSSPSSETSYPENPTVLACSPSTNTTGSPLLDFAAPCNLIGAIKAQCSYGPQALDFLSLPADSDEDPDFNDPKWKPLSPENERTCICQSQIVDATLGCWACLRAHEGTGSDVDVDDDVDDGGRDLETFVHAMMARYCDVAYTPTQSFLEFYFEAEGETFGGRGVYSSSSSSSSSSSTSASDPIGTSTDVSLYYTMSVRRSDAYDLAVPTGAGGNVTYTSTRTAGGRIVPTAVNARGSGSGGFTEAASGSSSAGEEGAASTTTSLADSGAAATAYAGAAGVFAVVAALAAVGL